MTESQTAYAIKQAYDRGETIAWDVMAAEWRLCAGRHVSYMTFPACLSADHEEGPRLYAWQPLWIGVRG